MRASLAIVLVACRASSTPPPANRAPAAERRCLPVVSKECGCTYSCGAGERDRDGEHWTVHHAFWRDAPLRARIDRWCATTTGLEVSRRCDEAFFVDVVCDGICAPKPADSTCHYDARGACVGE